MFASLMRLFAIRPFMTMAILGIPVMILVAVGLITITVLKFLVMVVLPIALVVWLVKKVFGRDEPGTGKA